MFPRTGEWFMSHGMMNPVMIKQILQWQQHGEQKKFGEIARTREMITGRDLKEYLRDLKLHG